MSDESKPDRDRDDPRGGGRSPEPAPAPEVAPPAATAPAIGRVERDGSAPQAPTRDGARRAEARVASRRERADGDEARRRAKRDGAARAEARRGSRAKRDRERRRKPRDGATEARVEAARRRRAARATAGDGAGATGPRAVSRRRPAATAGSRAGRRPRGADRRPPRAIATTIPRPRHDDPQIPDDVEAKQLDKVARVRAQDAEQGQRRLGRPPPRDGRAPDRRRSRARAQARPRGRHVVPAASASCARRSAITAYATGDFALALRELRTYRRITGRNDQLPLMVDSERGVGRPRPRARARPIRAARRARPSRCRSSSRSRCPARGSTSGQPEAALAELQIPQLDPERAFEYSPALFDAYATVLEELGRDDEAEQWWQRSDRADDRARAGRRSPRARTPSRSSRSPRRRRETTTSPTRRSSRHRLGGARGRRGG